MESQFPNAVIAIHKPDATTTSKQQDFDHVLIDMNQLLHICVRKSRTDGHALILLMKELDAVLQLATPTTSLVLAMDGPPSAAKLATQRQRRSATVRKTTLKLQQLHTLGRRRIAPKVLARKKRRTQSEVRTLCITPGTAFMHKAEQAILYWAWQRFSVRPTTTSHNNSTTTTNNHNTSLLRERNIKVFLSPSTVPGEGEVKLLEWLYHRSRRGASVAILGGDSDLVLEGLVVPVASTHNVFLLMPDGSKRYLVVSCWEMTRKLQDNKILPHMKIDSLMTIRTDVVLLLVLNGNDYLPKLRGSSGFNRLFHSYLKLQREWNKDNTTTTRNGTNIPRLLNPDTLDFDLDYCIEYFSYLAAMAPENLWASLSKDRRQMTTTTTEVEKSTALSQIHNLMDAGFLPQPMVFEVLKDDGEDITGEKLQSTASDDDDENDGDEDGGTIDNLDDAEDDDLSDAECDLVRLLLGEPGSEDFFSYEVWHPKDEPIKNAKHRLATMALRDLAGLDEDDEDVDDEIFFGSEPSGYEWELRHAAESDIEEYLYGLLWNIQTYQDGVCPDYSYNYGKRLSPTASEIADHFKEIRKAKTSYGLKDLRKKAFSPSVSAGLSCLAALPSSVKHLVPEPYNELDDDFVEKAYAECMNRETNVFDLPKFEEICETQLAKIKNQKPRSAETTNEKKTETQDGRRILMGNHYWTVISRVPKPLARPFAPPEPFSERLSKLRPNKFIRMTHLAANENPIPRDEIGRRLNVEESPDAESFPVVHSQVGPFLEGFEKVEHIPFKLAYQKEKERKGRRKNINKVEDSDTPKFEKKGIAEKQKGVDGARMKGKGKRNDKKVPPTIIEPPSKTKEIGKNNVNIAERMKRFKVIPPPTNPPATKDQVTAMACLKQLQDTGLLGHITWNHVHPSKTSFASFNPVGHECVSLDIAASTHGFKDHIFIEQDRDTTLVSRQILKQHLADLALRRIFGHDTAWESFSFKELREKLERKATNE